MSSAAVVYRAAFNFFIKLLYPSLMTTDIGMRGMPAMIMTAAESLFM